MTSIWEAGLEDSRVSSEADLRLEIEKEGG